MDMGDLRVRDRGAHDLLHRFKNGSGGTDTQRAQCTDHWYRQRSYYQSNTHRSDYPGKCQAGLTLSTANR